MFSDSATSILIGVAAAFALVNVVTFALFGFDKNRAASGGWRISESALLTWALIGGWFGAKLAQRRFRHKTRKQPFRSLLNAIPVLWLICAVALWVSR